jgi:gas vesicle protein
MDENQKKPQTSLPKMKPDTGYGLGFFCGAIVGGLVTYLYTTEEGEELRQQWSKEFKKHQQTLLLESMLPADQQKTHSPQLDSLRKLIANIQKTITPQEKSTTPKPASTTSKASKRYFNKKKQN